eukprot:3042338-Prymnesium_polylepis.1
MGTFARPVHECTGGLSLNTWNTMRRENAPVAAACAEAVASRCHIALTKYVSGESCLWKLRKTMSPRRMCTATLSASASKMET